MNSADRSIGRMDLALRRRFFWLELYPQPEILQAWLSRPGNNPVGFDVSSLIQCNELLAGKGITAEQHIGHALFMMQSSGDETDVSAMMDVPLTANQLKRVVDFSVLPYVRELWMGHFGNVDKGVCDSIRSILCSCIG
jgi:hypothetical protein